jgi:aryl-alcohol dehydrogenase-like predicted oxidoreductase
VVLATKFGMKVDEQHQGAKPDYVQRALDASLRRLRTDHIDLYQLHQPDPTVPIAETLGALNDAVQAGKVREIGCSNFSAAQLREAEDAVKGDAARLVSVQNEYSLLQRAPEAEVLPECERLGLAFLPYFPLASGLLTGKYKRGETYPQGSRFAAMGRLSERFTNERNWDLTEKLQSFVAERGRSLTELAFSWLAAQPAVASIIAGATRAEQVVQNVAAVNWTLSSEELAEVERLTGKAADR